MSKVNTILMVDDNEAEHIIAQITLEALEKEIKLLSAYDGREALELLETLEPSPDVIFLDINMPGMDGHEFLAEYKNNTKASSIIMLTSSDQESDKQKCLSYPFVKEYIVKPLERSYFDTILQYL